MDLDEFDWKTDAQLRWTGEQSSSTANWTFTYGDNHVKVDSDVLITGSLLVRHILLGSGTQAADDLKSLTNGDGDINVKSLKGTIVKAGNINKTVLDLKQQIYATHGISVERQRLFISSGSKKSEVGLETKQFELDEDWRTLESYDVKRGDTLQISLREPWQRTDIEAKTTTLVLPELCQRMFESFIKLLYDLHYRPSVFSLPESASMEEVLALYWLAAHFQVRPLGVEVIMRLEHILNKENAFICLQSAIKLGLGSKLIRAAAQLTGQALHKVLLDELNHLPIPILEAVLSGFQTAENFSTKAKRECVASYFRHYAPRLVHESYCRLAKLLVGSSGDDSSSGTNAMLGSGMIDAEYILFLLGLAVAYQDEASQQLWTDCAAQSFADLSFADLSSLPLEIVIALLNSPVLGIESEDSVYEAVKQYVELQGGKLSQKDKEGLWRCCRFAFCSHRVQMQLLLCPDARSLASEYLADMVVAKVQASEHVGQVADHETHSLLERVGVSAQALPRTSTKSSEKWRLDADTAGGDVELSEEGLAATKVSDGPSECSVMGDTDFCTGNHQWRIAADFPEAGAGGQIFFGVSPECLDGESFSDCCLVRGWNSRGQGLDGSGDWKDGGLEMLQGRHEIILEFHCDNQNRTGILSAKVAGRAAANSLPPVELPVRPFFVLGPSMKMTIRIK